MSVFQDIYRENRWNGDESLSGPGSSPGATDPMVTDLLDLLARWHIRSVLDVGCGDGAWMPKLPGYLGIDPVPQAIGLARSRHPERRYVLGELSDVPLPPFDLVIVRDVIQHLPLADADALLLAVAATGSRLLLCSTYIGGLNVDIEAGDCYAPDMTADPFDLGEPLESFPDGYSWTGDGSTQDPRKMLALWEL